MLTSKPAIPISSSHSAAIYFPVRLHLKAEKAIGRFQSAGVLPERVSNHLECAQGMILDLDFQPSCDLVSEVGCGKPQFALAVLVELLRDLPQEYHLRTFLLVRQLLWCLPRDDIAHGALLLIILGAVIYASQDQKVADTVLAEVFDDIRDVATLLHAFPPPSPRPVYLRVVALKDAPGLLLTKLRCFSQDFGQEDLLKFKYAS
ncbi:hypothetical protein C8R44DRAFT_864456 [Mycena epipterygia]|nr:hypothetical protein C8R44DRAFT_864456 [Mycena epipterygia]